VPHSHVPFVQRPVAQLSEVVQLWAKGMGEHSPLEQMGVLGPQSASELQSGHCVGFAWCATWSPDWHALPHSSVVADVSQQVPLGP
jgi:hypothetical protein